MAEHPQFSVSVVTPEGAAFEGEAEMLDRPRCGRGDRRARAARAARGDAEGGLDARPRRRDGEVHEFATGPGFFQVLEDRAIALVDDAVARGRDRRRPRAQRQLDEAKAELEKVERGESTADRWQLEQRIRHAENHAGLGQSAEVLTHFRPGKRPAGAVDVALVFDSRPVRQAELRRRSAYPRQQDLRSGKRVRLRRGGCCRTHIRSGRHAHRHRLCARLCMAAGGDADRRLAHSRPIGMSAVCSRARSPGRSAAS